MGGWPILAARFAPVETRIECPSFSKPSALRPRMGRVRLAAIYRQRCLRLVILRGLDENRGSVVVAKDVGSIFAGIHNLCILVVLHQLSGPISVLDRDCVLRRHHRVLQKIGGAHDRQAEASSGGARGRR